MEVVRTSLRDRGFSEQVSSRVAQASKRLSTLKIYESKWAKFVEYCTEINLDPLKSTVIQVADFLYKLFQEGLQVQTIQVYRTAIGQTLSQHSGVEINADGTLNALMKSFTMERPRLSKQFPQWDLSLVLGSLIQPDYEPMSSCELKRLSHKTLFLMLLASGRRRSEVHALDIDRIIWKEDGSSVTLYPVPGFLPKVLAAAEGGTRFTPIMVGNSRHEPDRLLCPVRALRHYIKRTKQFRRKRNHLFISFQAGRKSELHVNTISSWVKQTIKHAYETLSLEDRTMHTLSTHEIRAMAASLSIQANYNLDSILNACVWKQHTTFTDFYLRDLSHIIGRLRTLGPLVAAGALTNP
jgi:integrase